MPLFYYICDICQKEIRRVCNIQESKTLPICCGSQTKRNPRPVTARCIEVIDNGIMTKKLERLTDAERLFKERAKVTKKQRGE